MKKTGEVLKAERLKQNLDIEFVSDKLKISEQILRSIETGDTSDLPPKTFTRGFVQSYARFLKLDTQSLMDLFQEEMGSTRPLSRKEETLGIRLEDQIQTDSSEESETFQSRALVPPFVLWVALGAIVLGIAVTIVVVTNKYQKEALPAQMPKSALIRIEEPAPKGEKATASISEAEDEPDPKNLAAGATADKTPMEIGEPKPNATTPLSEVKKPEPPPLVATLSPPPPPAAASEKPKPQELIIEAFDRVEIKYSTDEGKTFQTETLEIDQIRTIKAPKKIKIEISNGGAVNIIHNGRDLKIPASLGQSFEKTYE